MMKNLYVERAQTQLQLGLPSQGQPSLDDLQMTHRCVSNVFTVYTIEIFVVVCYPAITDQYILLLKILS